MLDAYIIERIRREREAERDGAFIPLHIDAPDDVPPPKSNKKDDDQDRGSVVIDFNLSADFEV